MHRIGSLLLGLIRLLAASILGALLVILRYVLKTPQPLTSILPGEAHLFKWTHGHVFYKVCGVPDAPPLVLLHAPQIGGSSYEFRGVIEQLAQHYHVYALDLLGFGLSDRPRIYYSGETYTMLYQDFLTQVVLQPAVLVASGLSCNYSIAVASTRPELCQRLVLLSPGVLLRKTAKQHDVFPRLLQQPIVELFVYAFLTTPIVLRTLLAQQRRDVSDDELNYIYASAHQLGAHHVATALLTGQLVLDVSQQIETLQTPTLLLWGAKNASADESVAELYAANEQTQGVLIPNAGLRLHEEQPDVVVAQLMQWYVPTPSNDEVVPQSSEPVAPIKTNTVGDTGLEVLAYTKEDEEILTKESTMATNTEQVEAYCVKCKEKRTMQDPTDTVTKNGRRAKTGTCPVCGTKLFRFVS